MSNKTRLQTNNTNLQALIDKANALPDANGSGGGNAEIVIGTVTQIGPLGVIYYIDGNHMLQQSSSAGNISVLKNSIIYIHILNAGSSIMMPSGVTIIASGPQGNVCHVTQDFIVKFEEELNNAQL